jgi:hypothetical protein
VGFDSHPLPVVRGEIAMIEVGWAAVSVLTAAWLVGIWWLVGIEEKWRALVTAHWTAQSRGQPLVVPETEDKPPPWTPASWEIVPAAESEPWERMPAPKEEV